MTACSQITPSRSFYEGELVLKKGSLSKTKIFASILKNDPSMYWISFKQVPKDEKTGQVLDRIDPYTTELELNITVTESPVLGKDWNRIDLIKCQIMPSAKDKKAFKLLLDRSDENKSVREIRFFASDFCSRNVWVKKLLMAKNQTFEADDCQNVDIYRMIDLQKQIDNSSSAVNLQSEGAPEERASGDLGNIEDMQRD